MTLHPTTRPLSARSAASEILTDIAVRRARCNARPRTLCTTAPADFKLPPVPLPLLLMPHVATPMLLPQALLMQGHVTPKARTPWDPKHVHTCMHTRRTWACARPHAGAHAHTHAHTHTRMHTCTHTNKQARAHMCTERPCPHSCIHASAVACTCRSAPAGLMQEHTHEAFVHVPPLT